MALVALRRELIDLELTMANLSAFLNAYPVYRVATRAEVDHSRWRLWHGLFDVR